MTAQPRVLKVADFGLARTTVESTTTYTGDAAPIKWLAPEAIEGKFSTAR
jgi:hypothetical protein